jgi:hypothetical protein
MTPSYSYLSAGGASAFADGYSNLSAYVGGGDGSVFLYDSATVPGSTSPSAATGVSFVNLPAYSYMSGQFTPGGLSSFINVANGFSSVYAVAQGSGDVAYLDAASASGSDFLAFANGAAGIRDSSGEAIAQGFQIAFATGSSGGGTVAVAGTPTATPSVDPDGSQVSYADGNVLDDSGFATLGVDDSQANINATDFVFSQLGSWTG